MTGVQTCALPICRSEWDNERKEYYSRGSHYGLPASMVLYRLAHMLNIDSPFLLWCVLEQVLSPHLYDWLRFCQNFSSTLLPVDESLAASRGLVKHWCMTHRCDMRECLVLPARHSFVGKASYTMRPLQFLVLFYLTDTL